MWGAQCGDSPVIGLKRSFLLDLVTTPRCEASVRVRVARWFDSPSFFVVSPSSWRSSNIPVMGFMSFLSPPECAFIPLWHRRRGFPGESYKCPSGGTVGTSLFPSARKLSSERRQSSAWWETWRSFWSALGCDSQCWSEMRQIDRNDGIWAKSKRSEIQHLSRHFSYLILCQCLICIFIFQSDITVFKGVSACKRDWVSVCDCKELLSWIYLLRRFCFDELLINLLGSWGHSEWRLDLLVVLTGEPELNILIAVFGFEKVAKSSQSIWGKHTEPIILFKLSFWQT